MLEKQGENELSCMNSPTRKCREPDPKEMYRVTDSIDVGSNTPSPLFTHFTDEKLNEVEHCGVKRDLAERLIYCVPSGGRSCSRAVRCYSGAALVHVPQMFAIFLKNKL